MLGMDARFEGVLRFSGTLRLDGVVVGKVHSEPGSGSVLVINHDAVLTGDIIADSVLINGKVHGDILAQNRVELFESGSLRGDVATGEFMIENGGEFHGQCRMLKTPQEAKLPTEPSPQVPTAKDKVLESLEDDAEVQAAVAQALAEEEVAAPPKASPPESAKTEAATAPAEETSTAEAPKAVAEAQPNETNEATTQETPKASESAEEGDRKSGRQRKKGSRKRA